MVTLRLMVKWNANCCGVVAVAAAVVGMAGSAHGHSIEGPIAHKDSRARPSEGLWNDERQDGFMCETRLGIYEKLATVEVKANGQWWQFFCLA